MRKRDYIHVIVSMYINTPVFVGSPQSLLLDTEESQNISGYGPCGSLLRHDRDVHPTWVEGRVPCVILTSTGFSSDET